MARPRRTRRINAVRDDDEGGRAARRTRRSPDTSAQQAHEPTKKQHQKHDTHTPTRLPVWPSVRPLFLSRQWPAWGGKEAQDETSSQGLQVFSKVVPKGTYPITRCCHRKRGSSPRTDIAKQMSPRIVL